MTAAFAAHLVHYLVTVGGLAGVAVLLLPHYALRGQPRPPRSLQEQRIADLRYTVEAGLLGTGATVTRPRVRRQPRVYSRTALPLAVTASAAAAGVHAAVGPAHMTEGSLVAAFFIVSALFQLGWSLLVLNQPNRRLLEIGAGVNAVCIVLWAVTRTSGLPFGLGPGVERVGSWDVMAVTWEAVVVVGCLVQLNRGQAYVGAWTHWSTVARGCLVASVLALGMLSITGSG